MGGDGGLRNVDTRVYIENSYAPNSLVTEADASRRPQATLLKKLQPYVAEQAVHDSEVGICKQRFQPRRCTPNTRVKVRRKVVQWLEENPDEHVFWLTGPAGAGKSTIARSIASPPDDEERHESQEHPFHVKLENLAATFFFSSTASPETCSKKYFVPTLAYQLFRRLPEQIADKVADVALRKIEKDPAGFFKKVLKIQFQALILDPFSDLDDGERASLPKLIIIDGVNEVGDFQTHNRNIEDQNDILSTLLTAAMDPFFPFRILFSSRPEPNISNSLSDAATPAADIMTRRIFLDEDYDPKADVRRYLESDFNRIYRSFYPSIRGQRWPEDAVLEILVENSSGHFAYPAAIVLYVEHGYTDVYDRSDQRSQEAKCDSDPLTRLAEVVNHQPNYASHGKSNLNLQAFAALDYFYASVINSCLIGSKEDKFKWLSAVSRNPDLPAWFWKKFLAFSEETHTETNSKARSILQGLDSLLFIPPDDDREKPYQFYHKTFLHFLAREELRMPPPDGHERKDGRFQLLNVPPRFDCASEISEFMQRCFMKTLRRYGPGLEPGADEIWISLFLSAIEHFQPAFDEAQRCPEEDLALCHMGWWTARILGGQNCKSSTISRLFQFIHFPCPWYRCTGRCRAWRRGIIKACKDHGWHTPGASVLLRNSFVRSMMVDGTVCGYPPATNFRPSSLRPIR